MSSRDVEWTIETPWGPLDVSVTVEITSWGSSDSYWEQGDSPELYVEQVFANSNDELLSWLFPKDTDITDKLSAWRDTTLGSGYREGWVIDHGWMMLSSDRKTILRQRPRVTLNENRTVMDKLEADLLYNFNNMFEPDEPDPDYDPVYVNGMPTR